MQSSSKCALYKNFKLSLKLEKYLIDLDVNKRINLTRFRLSNHRLPIEVGRYNNTIRTERICVKCANYDICDEYHCMFICENFKEIRTKCIPKNCIVKPSVQKFCDLLSCENSKVLSKLANFSKVIIAEFRQSE